MRGMSSTGADHPIFARFYAWVSPRMDRDGVAEYRKRLVAGLSGRVIEVGAGNGLNFPHYPREVTSVTAVEPASYLRDLAEQNGRRAPVPVKVVDGVADRLPAEDESFDAAVASLVLCSVPDQPTALGELYRVLRPGGHLRFFEHVRADTPALRRVQRAVDATLWPRLGGGCHTGRDTVGAILTAGFEIRRLEQLRFPDIAISMPSSPHVLGVAVRPAGQEMAS